MAGEAELQKELDDAVDKVKCRRSGAKPTTCPRRAPKGGRNLHLSKLPRIVIEIS